MKACVRVCKQCNFLSSERDTWHINGRNEMDFDQTPSLWQNPSGINLQGNQSAVAWCPNDLIKINLIAQPLAQPALASTTGFILAPTRRTTARIAAGLQSGLGCETKPAFGFRIMYLA